MIENGLFISFEGPDGAGKTSVLKVILDRLKPLLGERLLITREPGGNNNVIAENIRVLLLNSDYPVIDSKTEVLLFAAARREHVVKTIIPALKSGKIVISDRYIDSSITYQGGGRKVGEKEVFDINLFATDGLLPNKTIYFDVRPEIGIERINSNRVDEINRLDKEEMSFHNRVNEAYHSIITNDMKRFHVINAERNFEDVVSETWRIVTEILQI